MHIYTQSIPQYDCLVPQASIPHGHPHRFREGEMLPHKQCHDRASRVGVIAGASPTLLEADAPHPTNSSFAQAGANSCEFEFEKQNLRKGVPATIGDTLSTVVRCKMTGSQVR